MHYLGLVYTEYAPYEEDIRDILSEFDENLVCDPHIVNTKQEIIDAQRELCSRFQTRMSNKNMKRGDAEDRWWAFFNASDMNREAERVFDPDAKICGYTLIHRYTALMMFLYKRIVQGEKLYEWSYEAALPRVMDELNKYCDECFESPDFAYEHALSDMLQIPPYEMGEMFDADGNFISQTNPNGKWDWYQIGGRWDRFYGQQSLPDGSYTEDEIIDSTQYDFIWNVGIVGNLEQVSWDRIPSIIITPDREWHERDRFEYDDRGWCNAFYNDFIEPYRECFFTIVDFHD